LTRLGHSDLLGDVVITAQQHVPDSALLEWIREAADATGRGGGLTPDAYDRWAIDEELERRKTDPTAHIVRYCAIRRRFETWANALYRAGLLTKAERDWRKHRPGVQLSDRELIESLSKTLDELGPEASRTTYRRHRETSLTGPNPPPKGIPSDACLTQRIGKGSWAHAKHVALKANP
jgi:hypothetical protein